MEKMVTVPDASFWNKKRVLLTGHTGFKGSWLSLWLTKLGATVAGISRQPHTDPNLFDLLKLSQDMRSEILDIQDAAAVQKAINDFQPEIVFHMAAQALVRPSYLDPLETFSTNILGTANVLEAIRNNGQVKAVVNVTTDKCYENNEWLWPYRETDRLGGHDPYSGSKACAELIAQTYQRAFFNERHITALASARAGNVIGGGDWSEDRLIPDALKAWQQNQVLYLRNPQAIRPWQHVLEPLRGYLLLAQNLFKKGHAFASGWNFGPQNSDTQSVADVVTQLAKLWGANAQFECKINPDQAHEASTLKLDISKADQLLNWRPELKLSQALSWVVEWQHRFSQQENMKAVCLAQIQAYESVCSKERGDALV